MPINKSLYYYRMQLKSHEEKMKPFEKSEPT